VRHTAGLSQKPSKALARLSVIGVQFAGEIQADLVM